MAKRARGARVGMRNAENKTLEQYDTIPASEVMVGDWIVFDQQAKASEVIAITEEEHSGVSVRRIRGEGQAWIVRNDHEVNRQIV